ncbi:MAG: transposase, partial [Mucinivorans sp.]
MKRNYPTNLTDSQYDTILRIIDDKRKRHIVTDTQGLLLGIEVHAANEHDSRSGFRVLEWLKGRFERLKKIYADGGYRGELIDIVKYMLNYEMEITLRTD